LDDASIPHLTAPCPRGRERRESLCLQIFGKADILKSRKEVPMRETLVVSSRGQITLPASLRKKIGLREGSAVIIEDRGNELVLKPAAVFEIEMYSDRQVAEWAKADKLSAAEKTAALKKIRRSR
jgi:AbrB family looped-hinge helix DNA binding protein